MSIEPQCIYCNAHTKFRCKDQGEAELCDTYKRTQEFRNHARKLRGERTPNINAIQEKTHDIALGDGVVLQLSDTAFKRLDKHLEEMRKKDSK